MTMREALMKFEALAQQTNIGDIVISLSEEALAGKQTIGKFGRKLFTKEAAVEIGNELRECGYVNRHEDSYPDGETYAVFAKNSVSVKVRWQAGKEDRIAVLKRELEALQAK